jgi:hypothetical protein
VKRKIIRILSVLAAAGIIYLLDFLSALAGIPSRPRYSSLTVNRYLYINEKYNKFSYEPIAPIQETCINALLPEPGVRPCWYLRRHTVETIEVN